MNESIKETVMDNPTSPSVSEKERGVSVLELLTAVCALGAAVVVVAMRYPKLPAWMGD